MDTRYPARLVLLAAVLTVITLSAVMLVDGSHHQRAVNERARHVELQRLVGNILLFDEKLTSSALLAAHTGDRQWIDRYTRLEADLVNQISQALAIADSAAVRESARLTEQANNALVAMEYRSFDFVNANESSRALDVLTSQQYRLQKERYREGMRQMLELMARQFSDMENRQQRHVTALLWFAPLALAIAVGLWLYVYRALGSWHQRFVKAEARRNEAEAEVLALNGDLERRISQRTEELNESRDLLERQAHQDELTGLPNRRYINKFLEQALDSLATDERICVMLVDLDNFKRVNDSFGHAAGDELLNLAAIRLQEGLPTDTVVARLGGDEFLVVAMLNPEQNPRALAEQLLEHFSEPFQLPVSSCSFSVTPSIGAAIAPDHGSSVERLMCHADIAMYAVKDLGRNNVRFFEPAMNDDLGRRLTLESQLRSAIQSPGQFELHYQPQIDLADNTVCGVEALLRWTLPDGSKISPEEFIPVAEDSGLIVDIGRWVLHEAVRQSAEWRTRQGIDLTISINVASQQLQQYGFYEEVHRALRHSRIPPGSFGIELTESSLVGNDSVTQRNIEMLDELGVKLSMDDFGTGYSALSYLQRFPFDVLKIDRSFINSILADPTDAALVQGIVNMSRNIGLRVVAEGVETRSQCDLLHDFGCHIVQGYYFSAPRSAQNLVDFVTAWEPDASAREAALTRAG